MYKRQEEQCLEILEGLKTKYEEHHHVEIEEEALRAAVRLSSRYISEMCIRDSSSLNVSHCPVSRLRHWCSS